MPPGQDSVPEEKSSDAETPSTVSKFPLDVENISAEIAADLASALVGHVLFLKNQVPLCVASKASGRQINFVLALSYSSVEYPAGRFAVFVAGFLFC
jgi:hypothetical protein